ncbi:MAG: NAD-dependent dihydropyrimidine dehydrogenase subunit PreA [Oscillospiraceae bacterium]|nr:NAD-dependent dihydropyrimidine dehydrogenase subunit PreA [Oscillospiraceae bacterium]
MFQLEEQAARCLLCVDAPCTAACPHALDPARMVRAVRFENTSLAAGFIDPALCPRCAARCQESCVRREVPVARRRMAQVIPPPRSARADLSIEFCGVACENPFFLSSSVVASGYEMCARALEMGWGGVVYKTVGLLTPRETSPRFAAYGRRGGPFIGLRNMEQISDHPLEWDLEALRRLKANFPGKVIVGSIMGGDEAEWTQLARLCTEAGCDIIECNFSCPHMTGHGLGADVGTDPALVARYTLAVRAGTHLPILAKMPPNITSMELPARAAVQAGADGLAAINTVKAITGLDGPELAPGPAVGGKSTVSGYSGSAVKPIALRFVRDLAADPALKGVPISGMGGIETWHDGAEFLALGCRNLQVTTAVMQYGYRVIDDLRAGLAGFLQDLGLDRVEQLVGRALPNVVDARDLDRDTVCYPRFDRERCLGCGRCFLSCRDAGHQAIAFEAGRRPRLLGKRCVGCHLCMLVCPAGAISSTRRVAKPEKEEEIS